MASVTRWHNWVAENYSDLSPHSFREQKSDIEVLAGTCSLWNLWGKNPSLSLPSSWWFIGNSLLGLWMYHLNSFFFFLVWGQLSSLGLLCPNFLVFMTLVMLDDSLPQRLHFNLITSVKTLFPKKATFWGVETETSKHHFEGPQSTYESEFAQLPEGALNQSPIAIFIFAT